MVGNLRKIFARNPLAQKGNIIILSFLWVLGFVCGLYFISSSCDIFHPLLKEITFIRPSIVGLLSVVYIPVFISFIAICISSHWIVFLFVFIKSFAFCCCICGVAETYGYSSWLIRLLLLFSDSAVTVGMLLFWCRALNFKRSRALRELCILTIVFTAIGIIDFFLVSPYLVMLMNYS